MDYTSLASTGLVNRRGRIHIKRFYRWLLISLLIVFGLGALQYFGFIWHNALFAWPYEVKGLDVSHHQKKINWTLVKQNHDFQFVFMKATEGHDHTDSQFQYNWQEVKKQGILSGAYHFFSMRSSGKEQARHFMQIVPAESDRLPPVIDVEIHLNHPVDKVRQELYAMMVELEKNGYQKPILYVTYDTYNRYIKGDFGGYRIWIRDIVKPPSLDRDWTFWQYTNRGRIDGIKTYVDINVYQGSLQDFQKQFRKHVKN